MVLFGWYGPDGTTRRRGQLLAPDEGGGGGAATAAPPGGGGGESSAPASAPASSGGDTIATVFEPGTTAGDEIPHEDFKKQLVDYAKTQREKSEGERADRAAGKHAKSEANRVMPIQRTVPRERGPDGKYLPVKKPAAAAPATNGKPAPAPAVQPTVVNPPAPQLQPPAPAADAQPALNGFTPDHYKLGEMLGLSKAQVETFGGAGQFEGWVVRQRQIHAAEQQRQAQVAEQQRQQQAQQQAQWQQVQLPDGRTAWVPAQNGYQPVYQNGNGQQQNGAQGFQPVQLAGPEDDYDPAVVQMVKFHNTVVPELIQQARHFQQFAPQLQQLGQLQQELQQVRAGEQRRQMIEIEKQVDHAFGLVDKELFGEGSYQNIEQNQRNARVRASDVMAGLVTQYHRRGEALPPQQTLVEMARAAAFPDRIRNEALSKAAGASKELRGTATAVPTSRTPASVSDKERAMAKIREFQRDNGMPGE